MSAVTILFVAAIVVQTASTCQGITEASPNTNSTIQKVVDQIECWKQEYHQAANDFDGPTRPFVTLTFAQSLDGRIALKGLNGDHVSSSNLQLSGDDSWRMSHALRSIHDAILIGGKTFAIDNPRLTNRLWPPFLNQPRPVILDTHLNYFRKILGNVERFPVSVRCHRPIFCCSKEAAACLSDELLGQSKYDVGSEVLPCNTDENGKIDLRDLLKILLEIYGVKSLMVEGGASVLTSFAQSRNLVDCLCVAITPSLVGDDRGLPPFISMVARSQQSDPIPVSEDSFLSLNYKSRFLELGNDCLFLSRWPIR